MLLQTQNPWSSLEITKLFVAGLTPMLIAFIGLYLNQRLKRFEHMQWRNQKLIEKRLLIYDDLAPFLNDLLCYFTFVGNWKELTPEEIIQRKRTIDKKMYIAAPLFSTSFFSEMMNFINLCFKSYQGWGHNAKLLTTIQERKNAFGDKWESKWNDMFAEAKESTDRNKIRESYFNIMNVFSEDIGLNSKNIPGKTVSMAQKIDK